MTIGRSRCLGLLCLLAGASLGNSMVNAHGGEDHGDDVKSPAPTEVIAPRALAQSEDFELVAVLDEGSSRSRRLLVTLDRFKTNEPVVGATLEVDAGGQNVPVDEESPGVYVVRRPALSNLKPGGKLPLTISVDAGETSDLLATSLDLPAHGINESAHVTNLTMIAAWAAGVAIALGAVVWQVVRRRREIKGAQQCQE